MVLKSNQLLVALFKSCGPFRICEEQFLEPNRNIKLNNSQIIKIIIKAIDILYIDHSALLFVMLFAMVVAMVMVVVVLLVVYIFYQ